MRLLGESSEDEMRRGMAFIAASVAGHPGLDRGPDGPRYPQTECYVCEGEGTIWEEGEIVACPECDGAGYDDPYEWEEDEG